MNKKFWQISLILSIGSFIIFSNLHMVQPLLPIFSVDFNVSPVLASLTVSLVTFTLSIFILIFGPISDSYGRKNIMTFALFFSSLISIAIYFVPNFTMLLVLRALQGMFLAGLPAVAYAYIAEELPLSLVGLAIGIYISGTSLGGMLGRIISGIIADYFGWRYAFLINGILGLIGFIIFYFLLPNSANFLRKQFLLKNAIIKIFNSWRNPLLRIDYYIAGIIFFIFIGTFNYLNYYLNQSPFYLSSTKISLLYLTYLAGTFSSTLSGKSTKNLSIPIRIIIGLIIMFIGNILLLLKSLVLIIVGLIIFVFGFFFTHAASSNWVSIYATEAKASASSLYLLSYYIGGSIGSTLLGYVWQPFGWQGIIFTTSVFILIAIILVMKLNKLSSF